MTGRQRRRQYEHAQLKKLADSRDDIDIAVTRQDVDGIPVSYQVDYNIRSICGIREDGSPLFHDHYTMAITIPEDYPQVDAPPMFCFIGDKRPWHPNIRYYGEMAGHVCINALDTFIDIAWGVERVALYLRYDLYHALQEPPYPEDLKVAEWVRHIGEPKEYIFFNQE